MLCPCDVSLGQLRSIMVLLLLESCLPLTIRGETCKGKGLVSNELQIALNLISS